MHGRVKVKTTAQEQEEKRKERERKLKLYRAGYSTVCEKRVKGEYDEELLRATEQLLCGNPDVYTLWNVRREAFDVARETKTPEEYEEMLKGELKMIEAALRPNPKSYGAWHHRMWVMESMKNPPVSHDLMLCGKLLSMDARNFHCWDYRRWLSLTLGSGNKDKIELDFSFDKLTENFSNYSAWHYRTIFLPTVSPDKNAPCSITPEQHKKELELVQNAVFTDPADQSAWFYLRWLLGKGGVSKPKLVFGVLQNSGGNISASLALSKAERPSGNLTAELRIGNNVVRGHWECPGAMKHSHVWIFVPHLEGGDTLPEGEGDRFIVLREGEEEVDSLQLVEQEETGEDFKDWVGKREDAVELSWLESGGNVGKGLSTSLLEEHLQLCNQLLELEPESKWTLLTSVQLMRTLKKRDPGPNKLMYQTKILEHLEKLKKIDSLRTGFYSDLYSDCVLDSALESDRVQSSLLDLTGLGLTTLPSPTVPLPIPFLLATKIDLSGNPHLSLPTVRPGVLACLAHLPRLRHLCVEADFEALTLNSFMPGIIPCLPNLSHLELIPSCEGSSSIPQNVVAHLKELFPRLKTMKPV
ncbi:geranylgeranyl transferase type-2 subunit alpha [Ischnura elegans]|uniref:geranylgeranyl transferase type-2 subunit alpha n=1 Tax=Ischnura elegans TaxID=197161 RepID=UPI001ED88F97|nr:geranylgeranyl transferase type-2 subunit alpha [Ischnura elegans]